MKPAKFEYFDPTTTAEALVALDRYADEAKVLAGGQSLVPLMNLRLASPRYVVDINRIAALDYIGSRDNDSGLAIGGLTRQRTLERSAVVREQCPLLVEAIRYVGHPEIRNRGTIGGSLAHADPSAELPVVATVLDAELVVTGTRGERVIPAREFFVTYLTTALEPNELLTEVRFPPWPERTGAAFTEVARRAGDFAIVGVAATLSLDGDGVCTDARVALTGVGGTPFQSDAPVTVLVGRRPDETGFREVGRRVRDALEPESDIHASAEYRKEVAEVLVRRALTTAWRRASGEES